MLTISRGVAMVTCAAVGLAFAGPGGVVVGAAAGEVSLSLFGSLLASLANASSGNFAHQLVDTFRGYFCSSITRSPGPAKNHDINDLAAAAIKNALSACKDKLTRTNRWRPTVGRMAKVSLDQIRMVLDSLPDEVLTEKAVLDVLGAPAGGSMIQTAVPEFWVKVVAGISKVTEANSEGLNQSGTNHVARFLHSWFATEANEIVRGDSELGKRAHHAATFALLRAILEQVNRPLTPVKRLSTEQLRNSIQEVVTKAIADFKSDQNCQPNWFHSEFLNYYESLKEHASAIVCKLDTIEFANHDLRIDTAGIRLSIQGIAQLQAETLELQRVTIDEVRKVSEKADRIQTIVTDRSKKFVNSAFAASGNFVANFDGSTLPFTLHNSLPTPISKTSSEHFGRESDISLLESLIRPKTIVPVVGPTGCGKKYVVANSLRRYGISVGRKMPLAALVMDLSNFPDHHLLRSALRELRLEGRDRWFLEVAGQEAEFAYLRERLYESLQDLREYNLVTVLCEAEEALKSDESKKEIEEFFRLSTFNRGCGILTVNSSDGLLSDGKINRLGERLVVDAVRVSEISETVAVRIIDLETKNTAISEEVVKHLRGLFAFSPAAISEHTEFAVQKIQRDGRPLDALEIAFLITECNWNNWLEGLPSHERDQYSGLVTDDGRVTQLGALCLMAILKGIPVASESLLHADLPDAKFPAWAIEAEVGGHSAPTVSELGRRVLLLRLADFGMEAERLKPGLARLLSVIAGLIESEEAIIDFHFALEESRMYLARHLAMHASLIQCLDQWILQASVNSILRPEGLADSAAEGPEIAVFGSRQMTAVLTLAVRDHTIKAFDEFLATPPHVDNIREVTALSVRAYDLLLYHGQHVFGRAAKIADWRNALADRLLEEARRRSDDNYFRGWVLSWLANAALSSFLAKDLERCKRRLADVRSLIGTLDIKGNQFTDWVQLRMLQTEAQMETDFKCRMKIHERALQIALHGLRVSAQPAWWIPRVLSVSRLYLRENLLWETRSKTVKLVIKAIHSRLPELGARRTEFTVDLANTVLDSALRIHGLSQRIMVLRWALKLLNTDTQFDVIESPAHCVVARIKVLQELSRALTFASKWDEDKLRAKARLVRHRAEALLSGCLNRSDENLSLNLWRLLFRKVGHQRHWTAMEVSRHPSLLKLLERAEKWVRQNRRRSRIVGKFMLELRQLKYSYRGSCRTIAEELADTHKHSWDKLDHIRRQQYLTRAFEDRANGLRYILRTYGPFPQIFAELAWQTCSYHRQMQLAIDPVRRRRMTPEEKAEEYENQLAAVDEVFSEAKNACGRHALLLLEEARYRRYVHDFDRAIEIAAMLLDPHTDSNSRHPDIRRAAATILAETSLTATIYKSDPYYDRDFRLKEQLPRYVEMAYTQLRDDGYNESGLVKFVVLTARLCLERGEEIDFARIGLLYEHYVGGIGRYYRQRAENSLSEFEVDETPNDGSSLVREWGRKPYRYEFLMAIGQLYLRRVQLGKSPDVLADCYRAASAFSTTYVIERDFAEVRMQSATNCRRLIGRARPNVVCSFLLALSIYHAVTAVGDINLNPFPEAVPDLLRSPRQPPDCWLELAKRLFASSASFTLGQFSQLATRYKQDCDRLLRNKR